MMQQAPHLPVWPTHRAGQESTARFDSHRQHAFGGCLLCFPSRCVAHSAPLAWGNHPGRSLGRHHPGRSLDRRSTARCLLLHSWPPPSRWIIALPFPRISTPVGPRGRRRHEGGWGAAVGSRALRLCRLRRRTRGYVLCRALRPWRLHLLLLHLRLLWHLRPETGPSEVHILRGRHPLPSLVY